MILIKAPKARKGAIVMKGIIVFGAAGSGTTTLSRELAERLD